MSVRRRATEWDPFQWMLCVTVCKFSERDGLWEEGVMRKWRENLAGKEAQAAQCKKQSGKAVDCTPEQQFALQVGFISWNLTTFLLGFRTGMYPI